jgi:hypothetical protein
MPSPAAPAATGALEQPSVVALAAGERGQHPRLPTSPSHPVTPPVTLPPTTAPGSGLPFAFTAMIRSAIDDRCLIFSGNGTDAYPQRFDWGNGGSYCGLGTKDDLLTNKQAVWRFTNVGADNYVVTNGSSGSDQCLIFSGNGSDTYPSRYNWGDGSSAINCGFSSKDDLLANKQAVFRILRTGATSFQIMTSAEMPEKCLIFSGNGTDTFPSRYNWGDGASSVNCGFPDAASMTANKQAVWSIELL